MLSFGLEGKQRKVINDLLSPVFVSLGKRSEILAEAEGTSGFLTPKEEDAFEAWRQAFDEACEALVALQDEKASK